MGGATIYSYISQFGCDKLSKVVIIDISPKLVNNEEWKAGCVCGKYSEKDYWEDMELMGQDIGQFMWKFWRIVLPDFAKMPNELGELIGPGLIGENNEHVLISLWHSMFYLDYRDTIKDITVPTAYFLPGHGLYPKESAEFIKNNASANVKIVEFPDCSHMIPVEAVEHSIKEIDSFISNL